ncbi:MAG: hypothetical protein ACE5D1_03815 [Fidelibacterota bacterium]
MIKILFLVNFLLLILYILNALLGEPYSWLTQFIDLNDESNLPTWYSSVQLFLAALLTGSYVWSLPKETAGKAILYWSWPLILLFLSLDEVAMIHETLGDLSDALIPGGSRFTTPFSITGIWMFIIGVPFVLVMLVLGLFIHRFQHWPRKIQVLFLSGMGIFLGSAIGIETLSNWLRFGAEYYLEVCLEEIGEMTGETLLVWAGLELVRRQGLRLSFRSEAQPD